MAKTTHQPPGKIGRLKRSKYTKENTTSEIVILAVCFFNLSSWKATWKRVEPRGGGGVLPRILDRGVPPRFLNPYLI